MSPRADYRPAFEHWRGRETATCLRSSSCALAVGRETRCALDPVQQVKAKERLGVGFLGVAHRSIPRPAAIVLMIPSDGMVCAHLAARIRSLINLNQDINAGLGS